MSVETVRILREARALVEKGWTQGNYAVDKRGKLADLYGTIRPPARFCSEGAILQVCNGANGYFADARRALMRAATGSYTLTNWNDRKGRTQAEVLAAFDKAIALAEAAP